MPANMFTSTARRRRPRRHPFQHAHQPSRAAAHLAGADVAEIQRLHAARGDFIDQHHRQAGTSGDQTDLSFRIEFDIVEAFRQLAIGIGIDRRPRRDQRRKAPAARSMR